MSRETVNSYALHVSLFFNMLSPLIRLITNHRDIMQQQLNFMPCCCTLGSRWYAPIRVSIHRYTLQRQSLIAEFDSVLFRLKFTVLFLSSLEYPAAHATTVVGCNFGYFNCLCMYTAVLLPEGKGTACTTVIADDLLRMMQILGEQIWHQ